MDITIDFSQVIFILTANQLMNMLEPLQNRLEIIDVQAYIQEEKLEIAKNFLIKQTLESNGIKQELILYDNDTIKKIIQSWCYYESGVRELKRCFEKIARKYAIELLVKNPEVFEHKADPDQEEDGEPKEVVQTLQYSCSQLEVLDLRQDKNLEVLQKYLGPPPFDASLENRSEKKFPPGKINILTVGGMIGNVLSVECCYDESEPDKKGTLTSSGNLKNVLQESLKIAKINALKYLNQHEKQNLQQKNIHIHFMDGSAPKDGPSAGTAICTALISIAKAFQIPSNIAMTGELSLNGNVCKIGNILLYTIL